VRKIQIDWQTVIQFSELIKGLPENKPLFINRKIYNSTANDIIGRYCKGANVPVISIHGLRHTHASILLFAGVSIASVARRLGHASMTTTVNLPYGHTYQSGQYSIIKASIKQVNHTTFKRLKLTAIK
jgi:integrase